MSNEALLTEINELKRQLSQKDFQIIKLSEQVRLLQLLHYGRKSEKLTSEDRLTASLFDEAEDTAFKQNDQEQIEQVREKTEVPAHTRKKNAKAGRKPFNESLPREEVIYDLKDDEKTCACHHELRCFGEDIVERLKIIPAQVTVIREIRKKYVCDHCNGLEREDEKGVITAQGPKHLIPGSMADETLLAWSISEKFEFALPFYRQAIRLNQIGAPIPRATLSNLTITTALKCEPIYNLLTQSILAGPVINADETRVQVLKELGKSNQSLSWMWVFLGGPPGKESVRFQYDPSRSHNIPYEFLKGYSGLLQSDDYEAYHTAVKRLRNKHKSSIQHFLCWAHVRRLFYKYWEISKDADATEILKLIKDLFDLEDLRVNFSKQGFLKQRKNRSSSILESIKGKLDVVVQETPPKLAFGKAIAYTLDNWELLINYVDHYDLTPSNNSAENAIRPFVVGRKNWLFSGSPEGAKASSILYSLIESAKLQKHKPYDYLVYILRQIPFCKTEEDYSKLLPFNINPKDIQI